MKYEILLLSILIVASYSSDCTDKKDINDGECQNLATTNSDNICCYMGIYSFDENTKISSKCFEYKLSEDYSKDATDLNEIANAFLKNTTKADNVKYKCTFEDEEYEYNVENEINLCTNIKSPSSGDICASAYNDTVSEKYGHCCLLDYEFSELPVFSGSSGFTSAAGKTCIILEEEDYKNITAYLEHEGMTYVEIVDNDRRRRHLSSDDDIKIKRYNVNCGKGKPAGQSNGEKVTGATDKAESGTVGITNTTSDAKSESSTTDKKSDAKLVKAGVMNLILSLLI